jgi:hypothetical protein
MPVKKDDSRDRERKFYKDLGLPYCGKCLAPLATGLDGKPVCRIGATAAECPLVNKE